MLIQILIPTSCLVSLTTVFTHVTESLTNLTSPAGYWYSNWFHLYASKCFLKLLLNGANFYFRFLFTKPSQFRTWLWSCTWICRGNGGIWLVRLVYLGIIWHRYCGTKDLFLCWPFYVLPAMFNIFSMESTMEDLESRYRVQRLTRPSDDISRMQGVSWCI